MTASLPRILLVDDEPNVPAGLSRQLRQQFEVHTANSGSQALELIQRSGPFEVIVSDRNMPGMDGVALLAKVRLLAPETIRVMLTGQADLDSTIASVNEGHIFRFLRKPCAADQVRKILEDACAQYRLVTAERVLLEQTLRGSIKTLTEILALTNPSAFGRAQRVKHYVTELFEYLDLSGSWETEVAAMLSRIASVTLPPATLERHDRGEPLTPEEQGMVDRMLVVTDQLLANIPRLEGVREMLTYQFKRFDGQGPPQNKVRGEQIPWGARLLKIAFDYDLLEAQGHLGELALSIMRGRSGWYDDRLLKSFCELRNRAAARSNVREVSLVQLKPGMELVDDVRTKTGMLLVTRGQVVNSARSSVCATSRSRSVSRNRCRWWCPTLTWVM
ncbi:MAG: response regulator [Planctomycetota bacterium]